MSKIYTETKSKKITNNLNPQPASFRHIIKDLFQNEKYHTFDNVKYVQTFSKVSLTDEQKAQLVYPEGIFPLNFFDFYQTDKYVDCNFTETILQIVSFAKKTISITDIKDIKDNEDIKDIEDIKCIKKKKELTDGYIYGYYFNVFVQERFDTCYLKESCIPITLQTNIILSDNQYVEVYNDIRGLTLILSLSYNFENVYSTIQYSQHHTYIFQLLKYNGLQTINGPDAILTGLSENLKKCHI